MNNKIKELQNLIEQASLNMDKLNQNIKEADRQIEELKREDVTPKFKYPKMGEKVWIINEYGNIDWVYWSDSHINRKLFGLGMIFLTQEEADFEVERRKVIEELKLFAEPNDRMWAVRVFGSEKDEWVNHYYIYWNCFIKELKIGAVHSEKSDDIYFDTKEECQKAIDFVGEDRIKKYYLRVEVE